jgi:hypothetical protein
MLYTARNLIIDAYYLSGIVARDDQEVSGAQIMNGQRLLNGLLAVKAVDNKLIPFYKDYSFPTVGHIRKYFVEGLIASETVSFIMNEVRFPSYNVTRKYFFGPGQSMNVFAPPFNCHTERVNNGSDIYFFPVPDKEYPITIWGKYMLPAMALDTNLTTDYEGSFIMYLKYALADYICSDYNVALQLQAAHKLKELEEQLIYVSEKDLSCEKISTLSSYTSGVNYADYNIGRGWTASN